MVVLPLTSVYPIPCNDWYHAYTRPSMERSERGLFLRAEPNRIKGCDHSSNNPGFSMCRALGFHVISPSV